MTPPSRHGDRVRWRTLLGDYPAMRALRSGQLDASPLVFDFDDVAVPNRAFKRVVRTPEFDVAELALVTFLMARSRGVALRLFPVVLFARNPLPYLVCRHGAAVSPEDLAGRRIGVRSYTTTTAVWVRALLADRWDIDWGQVQWVTVEEAHVAEFSDPPNVVRAENTANLPTMLLDGAVDAAIVDPVPDDPRIVPVVPDAEAAYRVWQQESGAAALNHLIVVRESLASDRRLMRGLFDVFTESDARAAGSTASSMLGWERIRPSVDAALAAAHAQRLLARPLTFDDLVTDAVASLR